MKYAYPLSRRIGLILKSRGMKLAVAESCTGGAFCQVITSVPGSSVWFECGFVTYSNNAKKELLGIDPQLIKQKGVFTEIIAQEMAVGALKRSQADIALSITGIAGPSGGTFENPVGTVWFGIAKKIGEIESCGSHFKSGRKHVRDLAIIYGLEFLLKSIT